MSQPFPSDQDTSQSTNQASRLWTAAPRAALFISADHAALLAAAVAQAWLMVFLALGVEAPAHRNPALESLGLPLSLLASAGAALGLAGFAVALHDVLDRRHDRVVATSDKVRPVASGQVAPRAAAAAGIYALLGGLLAAGFLGPASLRVALAVAAGILFYNFAGRFIPSIAVLLPALLHALAMGVPNPKAAFLWPLVLTFTHVAVAQWWIWRRGRGIQGKPGIHLPAVGMGWGFLVLAAAFHRRPSKQPCKLHGQRHCRPHRRSLGGAIGGLGGVCHRCAAFAPRISAIPSPTGQCLACALCRTVALGLQSNAGRAGDGPFAHRRRGRSRPQPTHAKPSLKHCSRLLNILLPRFYRVLTFCSQSVLNVLAVSFCPLPLMEIVPCPPFAPCSQLRPLPQLSPAL